MFHAMLRMNRLLSKEEKELKVNKLIHELMLIKCQNSLIGIPGKLKIFLVLEKNIIICN
jgi:hypothetical protein